MVLFAAAARGQDADPLDGLRKWLETPRAQRGDVAGQGFAGAALSKAQAAQARRMLLGDHAALIRSEREKEWQAEALTIGAHTLKWKHKTFGEKPRDGWNLFISLHGGGNAPAAVNEQQWENQVRLYRPTNSLYIAPRAPTNTWNLWHEAHMDGLLDRLIEDAIVLGGVNPNRVYIMGYSAGGDGVYQLAPRMADRFAAAAMMAGHPNDASPLGLRNIGFTIHVGALDGGYGRNKVAAEWGKKLEALRKEDPKGYAHEVQLHAGRGHWMNLEDAAALEWMAKFTRNPLPEKVVWKQSGVTHDRFYWLGMPAGAAKAGQLVVAARQGQAIEIERVEDVKRLVIRLNDAMVNLDQPIKVTAQGKALFEGEVKRTIAELAASLADRGDPHLMFDGAVTVETGK